MNGYILVARKILESCIFHKPPLYLKLWIWMLMQARFKDHGNLKRGQFFTSIKEMREAMSYMVGYRKIKPTRKEIRCAYESLTKGTMIGTTRVTRGLIITICNYDYYQDPKSYEGHDEGHNEGRVRGTLKKKEGKKEGKSICSNGFDSFWNEYPKKKNKQKAFQTWQKIKPSEQLQQKILSAIQKQKQTHDWQKDNGQYIPYPTTWLNGARWEDETESRTSSKFLM